MWDVITCPCFRYNTPQICVRLLSVAFVGNLLVDHNHTIRVYISGAVRKYDYPNNTREESIEHLEN